MNNIIFYSNYCQNSKKVLTELTKTKIKKNYIIFVLIKEQNTLMELFKLF